MLGAEQARVLHGPDGDGCWNPAVCYSRRSYARHRDRRNRLRSKKGTNPQLVVDQDFQGLYWAVLIVYRRAGTDTPVHGVGAEIWQGQERVGMVPPIHCGGMVATQVHEYVHKLLNLLGSSYQIEKFASLERLDPALCPIRPCPCHPDFKV